MRGALLMLAVAGCAVDDLAFSPVFDSPGPSDAAYPFEAIDSITISIANEGEETDIVSARFARGDTISLTDIPFGTGLVMHAVGATNAGGAVAYGRTCAFSLAADGPAPAPHLFFSLTQQFAATDIAPLTRLNNRVVPYRGTALFLGGIATVEQFDPQVGAIAALPEAFNVSPRANAVDALIGAEQARVLLVGGTISGDAATSIELFDPIAGREVVNTDQVPLVGMTATSLATGVVVVAGGNSPGSNKAAVGSVIEISTSPTGVIIRNRATLAHPRTGHTATALGTSEGASVLIAGGTETEASGATVAAAELYKPLQHALTPSFAATMKHPRTLHKAVLMPDGSVLFIGGIDAARQPVRELERFTLEEGFTDAKNFSGDPLLLPSNVGVIDNSVTLLPDGRVLVAGGKPDADASTPAVTTAVFLQLDNLMGQLDLLQAQQLRRARAGHQATLLCDGTVLVTGGITTTPTAERYNPVATGRR